MNITGNKKALFSMHGVTDADKALQAMEKLADIHDFDIDRLNNISETGGIYVKDNGTILNEFDKLAEDAAKYKLVPTGLKFRYSEYPLFAAFIKLHGQWEGCFIGTGTMLFDMYKTHYSGKFNDDYLEIFSGENRVRDIVGFGLNNVINNSEQSEDEDTTIYTSNDSISNQLEVALSRLQNKIDKSETTHSKNKCKNKAQRKAERLQKHLEKVREKEKQKKEQEDKIKRQQEEKEKQEDALARTENGIIWTEVIPMEDMHFEFIDDATMEFNKRVEEYINNNEINNICECNIQESIEADTEQYTDSGIINEETNNENSVESDKNDIKEATEYDDEQDIVSDLDHDNYVKTESEKYRMQIKNDIINDIYERLLIKENWKYNNKNRLGFYLRGICLFLWREQRKNPKLIRGNGYTFSDDQKYCVINTGLLDTYGNFIYLIDHSPSIPDFYTKVVSVMYNKAALLKFNFNIDNVKYLPSPIKFVEDKSKLIFDAQYEDFDLDDTSHLFHIISERIERFPDKYKDEAPLIICDRIKSAIRQAVMISQTDYKYVIPKYDFLREGIQFLIPLYLDNTPDVAPELTIVVGKQADEIWSIYTVLYSDDAYDDARLISRASDSWLNMRKHGGN